MSNASNPYGNGYAIQRIADILAQKKSHEELFCVTTLYVIHGLRSSIEMMALIYLWSGSRFPMRWYYLCDINILSIIISYVDYIN